MIPGVQKDLEKHRSRKLNRVQPASKKSDGDRDEAESKQRNLALKLPKKPNRASKPQRRSANADKNAGSALITKKAETPLHIRYSVDMLWPVQTCFLTQCSMCQSEFLGSYSGCQEALLSHLGSAMSAA